MQSYPGGEINIGDCERVAPASLFFLIFENLSEITVVRGKIHNGVRILILFLLIFLFVFS